MRIGIDVGGTHTDAVIMDDRTVLAAIKSPTTADVTSGIVTAVRTLLADARVDAAMIECVMIGTTHFTNALVERKGLCEVGVVRLALPSGMALPPKSGWPDDLSDIIGEHVYQLRGGYEIDGREIAPFDVDEVEAVAADIARRKLKAIALSCVNAPVNDRMEREVAAILRIALPGVSITVSSDIGRIGLLERENSAIINAACGKLAGEVIQAFGQALAGVGITAPFFISQNDGTLIGAAQAMKYPVLTFASGPTNSIRGAAFLSGVKDALVMDVGGTTCDVGALVNGFPRESSVDVDVGGVRTNFRMPDILAVGLGGGTVIGGAEDPAALQGLPEEDIRIGPASVGYRLTEQALVFGGAILTATDIAVAANRGLEIGDRRKLEHLSPEFVRRVNGRMHRMFATALDQMKSSAADLPVILVGGGSILVSGDLPGCGAVLKPDHAPVANAVGAAIAQVSGEIEQIYSYRDTGRTTALEDAKRRALKAAVKAGGAAGSANVVDVEETPLAYIANDAVRVRVKAVADLKLPSTSTEMAS